MWSLYPRKKSNKRPTYRLEDLTKKDGEFGAIREKSYAYYDVKRDW